MAKHSSPEAAFGRVLKDLRNQKNISQETLAFESDLDRTFISLLERGLRQPSLSTIFQLAQALQVSPPSMLQLVMKRMREIPK